MPRTLEDWAIDEDSKREERISLEDHEERYPGAHRYCRNMRTMCSWCRDRLDLHLLLVWPWSRKQLRRVLNLLFKKRKVYARRLHDGSFDAQAHLDDFFKWFSICATHTKDAHLCDRMTEAALDACGASSQAGSRSCLMRTGLSPVRAFSLDGEASKTTLRT
jgi:hypothetical protein